MVFCSQCGTQGQGRFCAQCGAALASGGAAPTSGSSAPTSGSTSPSSPAPATAGGSWARPPQQQQAPPALPQESFTALIGSRGQLMPAFFHIASELFIALDQSIEPRGSRGIEANKMLEFRKMSGKSVPPYYETHVLPIYYDTIAAERVPGMNPANVLTWDGWHTFLHHKVTATPEDTFVQLVNAIRILKINLPHPLTRADLPLHPFPEASAREQKFQVDIRNLATTYRQAQSARVGMMAGILRQGAMNVQMASAPAGTYYYN